MPPQLYGGISTRYLYREASSATTLQKPNIANLEKMLAQTPSIDNGDGGGNSGIGGGRGDWGGGGRGDGEPWDDKYNNGSISADEKYALRGKFAKECILFNLPKEYCITASPMTKLNDI